MRIERKHAIIIGLLGSFILACLCAKFHVEAIEHDLMLRTKSALQAVPIVELKVFVDGRDVMLGGVAADERALKRAVEVVRNVNGVYRVGSLIRLAEPEAPAAPSSMAPATAPR